MFARIKAFFVSLFLHKTIRSPLPVSNPKVVPVQADEPTPWMDEIKKYKGMTEQNNNNDLKVCWKYTDCEEFQDVFGAEHAWCKAFANMMMALTGYKYNKSASAIDGLSMGAPCDKKYGAMKIIEHKNGRHHITFVDKDGDTGGNQNNSVCTEGINPTDKVLGYRWPIKAVATKPVKEDVVVTKYLPLAWESKAHPERREWSQFLLTQIGIQWPQFSLAKDMGTFHSNYDSLTLDQKINVVADMIAMTAYYESSWNPTSTDVDVGEKSNKDTWSVGLMQLSVTDQVNYGFKLGYDFNDLQDPIKNLRLTLLIMGHQIEKYGLVCLPAGHKGLYWATLHPGGKYDKTLEIASKTKLLAF